MRALIASTEGAGHFGPLVPFAEGLARRGDDVLVVGPPALAATVAATGHRFRAGADPPAVEVAEIWRRVAAAPAEASVLVNRELFGRLSTAAMLPTLEQVCDEWHPDVVLREPCEYASALAAERAGIPHLQLAISLARVEAGSLDLAAPVLEPYGPGFVQALRESPYLTRFPPSLDPSPFPQTVRYCEARVAGASELPAWWGADDRPLVYATLGSVAATRPIAAAAYRTLLDALAPLPVRVLLTCGRSIDPGTLAPLPANVHVEPWVAQEDVLPHASVVVCHGGSGTTFGALAAGVPLAILPLFADQPVNAQLVSEAGAGVVVSLQDGELPPAALLREAVDTVLTDPAWRRAAGRVAEEMRTMPDVDDVLADPSLSISALPVRLRGDHPRRRTR